MIQTKTIHPRQRRLPALAFDASSFPSIRKVVRLLSVVHLDFFESAHGATARRLSKVDVLNVRCKVDLSLHHVIVLSLLRVCFVPLLLISAGTMLTTIAA